MKKLLFVALAVAGMTVFASCDKDDDKQKGKDAAKAVCDCYKSATTSEEFDACEENLPNPNSVSSDFLSGYLEVIMNCESAFSFDFDDEE